MHALCLHTHAGVAAAAGGAGLWPADAAAHGSHCPTDSAVLAQGCMPEFVQLAIGGDTPLPGLRELLHTEHFILCLVFCNSVMALSVLLQENQQGTHPKQQQQQKKIPSTQSPQTSSLDIDAYGMQSADIVQRLPSIVLLLAGPEAATACS